MCNKNSCVGAHFRKLLGHNLGSCSMDELHEIDNQLERSLKSIRARKVDFMCVCVCVKLGSGECIYISDPKNTRSVEKSGLDDQSTLGGATRPRAD